MNCTRTCLKGLNPGKAIAEINPYSVLTPPGGFLEFLKITQFINIFLFVAC